MTLANIFTLLIPSFIDAVMLVFVFIFSLFFLRTACKFSGYSPPPFITCFFIIFFHFFLFTGISLFMAFALDEFNILTQLQRTYAIAITTFPAVIFSLIFLTVCLRFILDLLFTQSAIPALVYTVIWYIIISPVLYFMLSMKLS